MDILAGIVGQALRMIGFLVGFGHAGVIAAVALSPFPCCGGELRSRGRQGGVGLEEQVFVRAGIGQGELDASHGVDDFGAELQKFQAYGIGDGLGQRRLFQGDAADTVDEDIGEGGKEQAKLVGFVGMRAHAIGKQIELAVLDAVFHVAAWAIGVFVEFPGRDLMAIEGSDEEAAALFVSGLVFDLGDDAPWPGPGSGFGDVVEIAVGADRLAGSWLWRPCRGPSVLS